MRPTDRFAVAIAVSSILASFTLAPLTEDRSFLGSSWLLTLVLCGVGLIMRRTPLGSIGALAAQLLLMIADLYVLTARFPGTLGMGFGERFTALFADAVEHMRTEAAPMAPNDGVVFLFVASLGVITLLTDLLVVTLRKPALGLAPPLTVFLVPAIGLGTDTGIKSFLYLGLGYLAILLAEGLNRSAGWTRGLSRDTLAGSVQEQAGVVVWRAASYVAVPAVAFTLLAGSVMPTLAFGSWGFGEGGAATGGPLRLTDPTLDLKRNLTLPADRVVLTYRTNKATGQYLRMASLPAFSNAGWQNAQTSIEEGERLPQPPGLTEATGRDRRTTIQIRDFDSEYLPLPFAPRSFDANGHWGYDANSLVVISSDRSSDRTQATRNLSYTVVSRDIDPDPDTLDNIIAGDPPDASLTTALPEDLPQNIRRLAERITDGASSPAQDAAAIQAYLRDPDNFTYSTDPRPGSGYQALENFLFRDRQGYCEQFAAAMAVLARVVGIPSRVAVGFLPGTRNGDVWTVTARDAHAWPELFFSGYGWVRYEPTPSSVTGSAPSWSLPRTTSPNDPSTTAPDPGRPTVQAQPTSQAQQPTGPSQGPTTSDGDSFPWGQVLGFGGGALVLLALLSTPAAIRIARRRARLGPGRGSGGPPARGPSRGLGHGPGRGPGGSLGRGLGRAHGGGSAEPAEQIEAGWAEVRDTVRDLGRRWPSGSPRTIAAAVAHGNDPELRSTLAELSLLVERERYARHFTDTAAAAAVPGLVVRIRKTLLADRSWAARVRMTLLPRSVFRRR